VPVEIIGDLWIGTSDSSKQTEIDSAEPERYWPGLRAVVRFLEWVRPVLVGRSTDGYAATAAGLIEPADVCVVDGVVVDHRATAAAANARWRTQEAARQRHDTFRYGWEGDRAGGSPPGPRGYAGSELGA
jgi:pimeloyl-ACP methyl ester carboxylesterase